MLVDLGVLGMQLLAQLAGAFAAAALLIHLATSLSAAWRCRKRTELISPPAGGPGVTLIRPLCGLDALEEATLRSTFELDYPNSRSCCARLGPIRVLPLARAPDRRTPAACARAC